MANTFLTPDIIAKEALMALESNLVMAGLVHRDYDNEYVQVGDTVTVRKPAAFTAKNFTGSNVSAQDITESSVDVKLDRFRDVTVKVTSKQLSLDIVNFSEQVVTPALQAIAEAIDVDLLTVGIEQAAKTAAVSGTPVVGDVANVGKALDMAKAPRQNRRLVMPPDILYKYNTLDNLAKLSYSGDSAALREAEIGKVYTMETFMSQNCPQSAAATAGTCTSCKVTATAGDKQFSVTAGSAATATFKAGDQIIANGYLYTVSEDLTLVSSSGTLKVTEEIPYAITTAVDAKVITKAHALGFHRNGLALVTRQLALPMGAQKAAIASANGLAVRVVMDYDTTTKTDTISFDTIYGVKDLDTNLLVDFA